MHLETALKALKAGKARDPNGWVYELFKDGVIGENLKLSLLHMANIAQEQPSIRNMQVVSPNCVHSTQSFEANKCWIFKQFFLFIR